MWIIDLFKNKKQTPAELYNKYSKPDEWEKAEIENKKMETKPKSQEKRVLELFEKHPDRLFTPYEVQDATQMYNTPLKSIRRAISDLTRKGFLEKMLEVKIYEDFGRKNHKWRLKSENPKEVSDYRVV